jgi:hypothetical protein
MKLKSISPSRIKTWDMCRFKYWLTYHTDRKLKQNWGGCHGSLIHDILENYSNGDDTDWMQRLYDGYGGTLETLDYHQKPTVMESPLVWAKPKDYAEKTPHCDACPYKGQDGTCTINREPLDELSGCPKFLFDGSIKMLREVMDQYRDIWPKILRDPQGKMIGAEYGFRMPLPGVDVPVIGFMDLAIDHGNGTLEIIDYKTGVWTQNYADCRKDIQVRTYSLASRRTFVDDIEGRGFDFDNVIMTFDYFQGKPITLAFTEEEDAETERELSAKVREIQDAHDIFRCVRDPDTFWKCRSLCDSAVCKDEWKGKFNAE